jgi:hypothetical protein
VGASAIEGTGLFARRAFPEGETVVVRVQEDDDPAQYGNHSCDPNVWLADDVTLVTRRPVQMGEERTVDYGTMTVVSWGMECRCGAASSGRFSPFINARIAT